VGLDRAMRPIASRWQQPDNCPDSRKVVRTNRPDRGVYPERVTHCPVPTAGPATVAVGNVTPPITTAAERAFAPSFGAATDWRSAPYAIHPPSGNASLPGNTLDPLRADTDLPDMKVM
jgi:hypothetical protein